MPLVRAFRMKPPRTLADVIRAQAHDALQRGEASLATGDLGWARAWFERARRLVPLDPTILAALAGVQLRLGDMAAAGLFAEAAKRADTREIWLGGAAASLAAGDMPAARAVLARMLSSHVLPQDLAAIDRLASLVCADSGVPGWCGVTRSPDGQTHIWVGRAESGPVTVRIDGREAVSSTLPSDGHWLEASCDGVVLLGSPIDLSRMRRVEGFVAARDGGLSGWAWHPAEADFDPWIVISQPGRPPIRVRASDMACEAEQPMTRPRGFGVPAAALARLSGRLDVCSADGVPLAGSPLDPSAPERAAAEAARLAALECPAIGRVTVVDTPTDLSAPADLKGPPARAALKPDRPVALVVPVFRGCAMTLACLDSVFATCPEGTRVIVVDDQTPEPALALALDALAAAGRITLLRNRTNQGFPASANAGLRAAFALRPVHDALLLNSDTLVPASRGISWLARLRAAVHAAPDIGTAAPVSNDATILSYPARDGANPQPNGKALARLDRQAARANSGVVVDIPTSVGFCMYVRRECAVATGLFRPSLFAQGYGEENDFCIRARHLGWRHVAVPGVFVAHLGGASFGAARSPLVARNLAVLERLHPGYHAMIAAYQAVIPAQDALAPARRRLDAQRWATGRCTASVILVTHDSGGGVERVVRGRVREIAAAGLRAIVLRPILDPESDGGFLPGLCRVSDGMAADDFPNLVFRLPDENANLQRLLRADRPALFEVHHRLGHHSSVMSLATALDLPVEMRLHDYAAFCPRITLLGPERRYCGEPEEVRACEACVADAGDRLKEAGSESLGVAALRARSAVEFASARRVVVPSADMAGRLRRHFPLLRADVVPLENDAAIPAPPAPPPPDATRPRRICVIGAIGVEKGFDVLLACARDAAARNLPLEFMLAGHSTDDARLMATGRVFVTGRYAEADAEALIRAQQAHFAFLPSIWPETWGFTLGLAWRAGLNAVVFDVGAMGARVRASGRGIVLPLGLSAPAINNAFIVPPSGSLAPGW